MSIRNKLNKVAESTLPPIPITVPEWGDEEVYIKPMSGEEWEEHVKLEDDVERGELPSTALIFGTVLARLVEPDGERVFGDDELGELLKLPVDGAFFLYQVMVNRSVRMEAAKKNSKKTKR